MNQNNSTLETNKIKKNLISHYFQYFPDEAAGILNEFSTKEILHYLSAYPPDLSLNIFLRLNPATITDVLENMDDRLFSVLFPAIDPYTCGLLISRLDKVDAEDKIALLPEKLASEIREVLTFPPGSAGFLMDTRIITFNPDHTVSEVLKGLRKHRDSRILNVYVVDREGKLRGRVPIQVIAISPPKEQLINLVEKSVSVHVMAQQEEVVELLKDGQIISIPVVDLDNKLLGIIRYNTLIKAAQSDATEDVQAIFGAGREERALSRIGFAIRKRLPWLEINLATAFLAASVVGIFEDTIARITVLAVFLPVVAGQSGNTGSQALAVTIRGLALREFRIGQWLKVAKKELAVGVINGIAVALTTSLIVYIWASSFGLALIIGISMVFSMAIAGFSGAVIPILLKSVGQDPAQSSSIVLTTVTDIVGFFSFLGLATLLGGALGIV
jgi:magnesium transporter